MINHQMDVELSLGMPTHTNSLTPLHCLFEAAISQCAGLVMTAANNIASYCNPYLVACMYACMHNYIACHATRTTAGHSQSQCVGVTQVSPMIEGGVSIMGETYMR